MSEVRSNILETLRGLDSLPTLPIVVDLLNREIANDRATATSIAKIIGDDPAIMARVLKLVNSPLYAPTFKSKGGVTIQQAVVRLGQNALRNLVLTTAIMNMFPSRANAAFDRVEFWRHSICVGFIAKVLLEFTPKGTLNYEESDLALAGLCHDIGKVVLDQYFNERFASALEHASTNKTLLYEAEREVLGIDHAELGAELAQRWKLPAHIMLVMRHHHSALKVGGDPHEKLVHAVLLADYICNHQELGFSGNCRPMEFPWDSFEMLRLKIDKVPDILLRVHQEAQNSEIMLSLAGNASSKK